MFNDLYIDTNGLVSHTDIINEERHCAQLLMDCLKHAQENDKMENNYQYIELIKTSKALGNYFLKMSNLFLDIANDFDIASEKIMDIVIQTEVKMLKNR